MVYFDRSLLLRQTCTRSWNKGVRCMSLYFLMNLWYGRIPSWDIRVLVVFALNLVSVTDMHHYYYARYPTDYWHLAYMFSLVYFPVEVCLVGVFSHSVMTRRDPCVRVYAPLTLASPLTSKQNRTGVVTRLSSWAKRGGIWTDAWVCLHYWLEILVAGYFNVPLYCTVFWGVSKAGYIMA